MFPYQFERSSNYHFINRQGRPRHIYHTRNVVSFVNTSPGATDNGSALAVRKYQLEESF